MLRNGLLTEELRVESRELRRCWPDAGSPRLELRLELPQVAGAGGLNAYYRRLGQSLCRYCAAELLPELPQEADTLRLALSCRVELLNDLLLSLRCDLCRSGPRPVPAARFAAVWSRQTGTPMPLRAFLPDVPRPIRRLRALLREEARRRAKSGAYLYDPDRAAKAGRLFDPRNFYAAADGLRLFFPALTLGGAGEGIPEFLIPWGAGGAVLPGAEK